jgi:hypothetical protein
LCFGDKFAIRSQFSGSWEDGSDWTAASAALLSERATEGPAGAPKLQDRTTSMSIELILNLLWLLVAVALVCVWRTQWISQRWGREATGRRHLQEWSAVSLALVLLFFAVSMSDDMHASIVALEDCSASKRNPMQVTAAHRLTEPAPAQHRAVWAACVPVPWLGPMSLLGGLASRESWPAAHRSIRLKPNRAPPVSLS